jgi:hypothetical protein
VNVRQTARFYVPLRREHEDEIRRVQRSRLKKISATIIALSPEEIVEDAGLELEETSDTASKRARQRKAA